MFRINSIKLNIIIYLVLFTTIPLLIASSITLYNGYKSKKKDIFKNHLQLLQQVENDIDTIVVDIENIGKFVKKNYQDRKDRILNGVTQIEQNIIESYILDNNGVVKDFQTKLKSNLFIGYDFSNTEQYLTIAKGNSSYWSDVYLSNATNQPVISYSTRIDEETIAVFIIDLKIVNSFTKKYISGDGSTMIRVMDNNGVFLANGDRPEFVLQRKNISNMKLYKEIIVKGYKYKQIIYKNEAHSNVHNIGVYGITNKLQWYVVVKERYEYVFQTYFKIVYFLIAFIVLLVLFSLFVAIKLSKSILKPLDEVSQRMEDITLGQDNKKIDKNSYKELKKLIYSFLIMKNKIKKRERSLERLNQNLENKVEKKTKELQLLNQDLEKKVSQEIAKNMEKELHILESSKMIQMGEMIGNIAHQWRQPLSVISTAASGMKLQKEYGMLEDEKFYYYCNSIVENSEYLSETIDIFRNFIKEKKEKAVVVIQDRINTSLKVISATLESNHIKLINNIDYKEQIRLEIVVGELSQAIINIINNAKDALIDRKIEDAWIKIELKKQQNNIKITIEDNAGGVPDEIISKIFDPYFTTKHKSQGTGLGLHMAYKIVHESLKGKISVDNTQNGAIFTILLPLS